MIRRSPILAALALLAACATPRPPAPPPIHVMRHLDTPAGERDPDLTPDGRRRAEALVAWFAGKPLAAIYVTDFKRSRQTVAALAAARRLTPISYQPADPAAVIAAARAAGEAALIVGHSNTVPDLVERLGGERPAPLTHPDFGDIWTVSQSGTNRARLP